MRIRILLTMALLACCFAVPPVFAQEQEEIPMVISASVPFYPRDAQNAYVSGTVDLQVSTDGSRAISIVVKSGPALLARHAQDNIKTWEFEKHVPTTFEIKFVYVLQPSDNDANSPCGDRHSTAFLRLPTVIEVTAKALTTCDPTEKIVH